MPSDRKPPRPQPEGPGDDSGHSSSLVRRGLRTPWSTAQRDVVSFARIHVSDVFDSMDWNHSRRPANA